MNALFFYFYAQGGDCFYCSRPTWLSSHETLDGAAARLGVSRKDLYKRSATMEHLRRRTDGGLTSPQNLVMACADCNHRRGKTPVLLWLGERRSTC